MASRLSAFARTKPRTTAAGAAFALSTVGDLTAQRVEQIHDGAVEVKYDVRRALGMGSFSATFAVLVYVPFHRIVNRRFGEGTVRAAAQKTAADVFAVMPVAAVPAFFAWTSAMQGHSAAESVARIQANYASTCKGSLAIWAPLDMLMFYFLPAHFRLPASYVGEYAWATMASYVGNQPATGGANPPE